MEWHPIQSVFPSIFASSVPGTDSRPTMTLTRIQPMAPKRANQTAAIKILNFVSKNNDPWIIGL